MGLKRDIRQQGFHMCYLVRDLFMEVTFGVFQFYWGQQNLHQLNFDKKEFSIPEGLF